MDTSGRTRVTTENLSFPAFYAAAFDEVYRAIAITIGDADLAADATQEAFARALQRWDEVTALDNPRGWLYRVALNWARSRFRRSARELLTGRPPDIDAPELPSPSDPSVTLAMRGLPVEQRAVVVLRLYLDWSVGEVAAVLGVSNGTVKSRLARALDRLRERLEVDT